MKIFFSLALTIVISFASSTSDTIDTIVSQAGAQQKVKIINYKKLKEINESVNSSSRISSKELWLIKNKKPLIPSEDNEIMEQTNQNIK